MEIPPGIRYLAEQSPRILAPPISVHIFLSLTEAYVGLLTPRWAFVLLLLLSLPGTLTVKVLYTQYIEQRDAIAAGAILPPRTPDRSPGALWTLLNEIRNAESGYIGEDINPIVEAVGGYIFNLRILFENRIVTAEPEHIKAILATQFDDFEKGDDLRKIFVPLLGTGVFASDGEMWKFHRAMTRPFFTKDRISDFDNFDRHAEDALNQLDNRLREGFPVDFQELAARFTLDSATEFLFGTDVGSLSMSLPYPHYSEKSKEGQTSLHSTSARFAKAFGEAQLISLGRARFSYHWPLMEFWKDKLKEPMRIVHNLIDPIVQQAVQKKLEMKQRDNDSGEKVNFEEKTLLEHLVNATDDPIVLRDAIMNLLVAGRDTTASTLTFIVYLLAQHPDVLARLRGEIIQRVGSTNRPTLDDFREMKYLRAVINETLRLYPIVPFNLRASKKATTLPSTIGGKPFYIPANSRTPYLIFTMHRRKDLWGPDALEFDPDRFIDERLHKYLTPNPFIFLPFNAGPRICLGQQFAYHEMSFFIVRLLQRFSAIALATEAQPPASRAPSRWATAGGRQAKEKIRPKSHLTMFIQDGLWVSLTAAQ